eukprot:Tbor_TRINITY_DN4182_c0_g1::TRINITY_DN4182_c0_g1_i2::g.26446::m.26446/K14835/NOP2; 25S rRNA (cytosine2870-C5)-methyltransferase
MPQNTSISKAMKKGQISAPKTVEPKKAGFSKEGKSKSKKPVVPEPSDESDIDNDEEFDEENDEEFDEDEEAYEEEDDDIDFHDVEDGDDYASENSEEEDDDDFEKKAAKFKKQMEQQTQLALLEEAADQQRVSKSSMLGDIDLAGDETITGLVPTLSMEELEDRVKETLRILANFKAEREEGRSREEYINLLRGDLKEMFEYNDYLTDIIMDMFPPQEAFRFMQDMEKPRPTTIRTNTIKCKRRDLVQILTKRGVNVEPLEKWSKVGLQVFDSNVPIAGTVEYLAGHYMLQSAVSFLPVMALAPQEGERVLDMAAAPGGKTTYIAQLMKNTGVLFANDVSEPRIKSLSANIQRLGVTNCIVTNYDGVDYNKVMSNFDRVLLDAPCTGTGIISRDKSIKTCKTLKDVQRASQLQRRLLLSAIDACKPGGYVVYSTCSFLVEENEAVADYALHRRHVECVEMGLPFGSHGFTKYRHLRLHPQLANSRRYYPHVQNMDGFYVCKFRKIKNGTLDTVDEEEIPEKKSKAPVKNGSDKKPKITSTKNGKTKNGKSKNTSENEAVQKRSTLMSIPPKVDSKQPTKKHRAEKKTK